MSACERIGPLLDAYHDGELGRLRRWMLQRHLDGCPGCRQELVELAGVGSWVRESTDAARPPDVWSEICWRLPDRGASAAPAARRRQRRGRAGFGFPALGAGVVASAIALLVLVGPPELFRSQAGSVVRSLNTHGRPVMVLDAPGDATIIWLMDDEGVQSAEDASGVWI